MKAVASADISAFGTLFKFLADKMANVPVLGKAFKSAAEGINTYTDGIDDEIRALKESIAVDDAKIAKEVEKQKAMKAAADEKAKLMDEAARAEKAKADERAAWDKEEADRVAEANKEREKAIHLKEQYEKAGKEVPEDIARKAAAPAATAQSSKSPAQKAAEAEIANYKALGIAVPDHLIKAAAGDGGAPKPQGGEFTGALPGDFTAGGGADAAAFTGVYSGSPPAGGGSMVSGGAIGAEPPADVAMSGGVPFEGATPGKPKNHTVSLGPQLGASPVNTPTAEAAKEGFGKVKTDEEKKFLYGKFKEELAGALTADENGVIDPARAQAVLDKWRVVFRAIPGFSETALNKIRDEVNKALEGIVGSGTDMADVYKERVTTAMGEGDAVFKETQVNNDEVYKQLKEGHANVAQEVAGGTRTYFTKMINDLRGKATQAQIKELSDQKQNIVKQVQLIGTLHGKEKEEAIKNLKEMVDAYHKSYDEIVKKVETSLDKTKSAAERNAARGIKDANDQAAEAKMARKERLKAAAVARKDGGVNPIAQVSQMAQQLSAGFTGALQGVGGGMASFNQYLAEVTDPVQKFDALLTNARARLAGASQNSGIAGGASAVEQIKSEIRQLETRRTQELSAANEARSEAEKKRIENRTKEAAEKDSRDRDARRESNLDLAGQIANGKVPPIQMNINGINDVRQAVDALEKELLRRGIHKGGKKKLETK